MESICSEVPDRIEFPGQRWQILEWDVPTLCVAVVFDQARAVCAQPIPSGNCSPGFGVELPG